MLQYLVAHAALLPEGDEDLFLEFDILFLYLEIDDLAIVHDAQILLRMATKLREGGGSLGRTALFTYDQLAFAEVQRLVLEIIFEAFCPYLRYGAGAFVKLIGLREQLRAFHIEHGLGFHAFLSECLYPCGDAACFAHIAYPPVRISEKPNPVNISFISSSLSGDGGAIFTPL